MKTQLQFSTTIAASRERVWNALLDAESFKAWTAPFMEGSFFEGSWDVGARIRFLAPDGSGMSSVIAENRPYEFLSIKHIGEVKNGVDDLDSDSVRQWAPAFETYRLSAVEGETVLDVHVDVTPDVEQFMREQWPVALSTLKALAEGRASSER